MAGKRYTQKTLEADIKVINEDLARRGIDAAFEVPHSLLPMASS